MLKNRNAVITGASKGLGLAIAKEFLHNGANVLLCAREKKALEMAKTELRRETIDSEQKILICAGDISIPAEVDHMISTAEMAFSSLDILVNNAAIQGPIGAMEQVDWNYWKDTIKIDLLGPAYLIYKVLPIMKRQKYGKITNLSGGGATSPRENYSAYAAAKTGLVRLTETIAQETITYGIDINAIAPGAMNSQMLEETLAAGEDAVGYDVYQKALKQQESGGTPPELAARVCAYLASEKSDGISGRLISAVWDDWSHLDAFRKELMNSDIYTLRRITPQDRMCRKAN